MITPDRIHELARRTAQRFVNDEDPALRLYVFEGRHLLDLADVLQNELLDDSSRRVMELEAQLAAIGAGGVEPLRKRADHFRDATKVISP